MAGGDTTPFQSPFAIQAGSHSRLEKIVMQENKTASFIWTLVFVAGSILACTSGYADHGAEQPGKKIDLVTDNHVQYDIVIGEDVAAEAGELADTLAGYLQRMTGNEVNIETGDGTGGIAVGVASDFPKLGLEARFDPANPFRSSEYLLRTHSGGLQIIGATRQAAEFGMWDLLYRMGHRQFQPNEKWEIVPKVASYRLAADDLEVPDYSCRGIFYQGGWFPSQNPAISDFFTRNRLQTSGLVTVGHAWTGIITDYKAKHGLSEIPEDFYFDESWNKLNFNNPAVIEMMADYVIEKFEKDPSTFVVGVDPDDGYNGGEALQAEFQSGNQSAITDYVVGMANQVIGKVRAHFNDDRQRYIGILAYYYHAPPPSIQVDPNVIIQPAQSMFMGDLNFDQIVTGWRKKAPTNRLLTYAYGGYYTGRHSMPHGVTHPRDKARRIAELDRKYDFSTYLIDTGMSPGDNLVHYVMARTLWDIDEAKRADMLMDEFYELSFGEVQEPMRRFYELFLPGSPVPYGRARVGAMYNALNEAYQGTTDPEVRARIEELIKYTRYCELWFDFDEFRATQPTKSVGTYGEVDADPEVLEALQQATSHLMKYICRISDSYMVPVRMAMISAGYKFWGQIPDPAAVDLPDPASTSSHPWYDRAPFTGAEFEQILREGIANNP